MRAIAVAAVLVSTAGCRQLLGLHEVPTGDATARDGTGDDDGNPAGDGALDSYFGDLDALTGYCLGTVPFEVCLDTAPGGLADLTAPIDTDTCAGGQPNGWAAEHQPAACFILSRAIIVETGITVTGSRPLVLFAKETIVVASLDVASHVGGARGPGSDTGICPAGTAPNLGGGGAGGSLMTIGGDGGDGGAQMTKGHAGAALGTAPVLLRGGCPGQDGSGTAAVAGGHGGGAVYLLAGTSITISGSINASGAGGRGGGAMDGGGGGGAGGMIVLVAPTISANGAFVIATGGGGGGGGSDIGGAPSGMDPTPGGPPGSGAPPAGGSIAGGNGYDFNDLGAVAGSGGVVEHGGGAGGGGAGYIHASTSLGTATLHPPAS